MIPSPVEVAIQNAGILINNNEIVESLRMALVGGQRAESMVPSILEEIIDEGAWLDRMDANGRRYTFERGAFTRFIETPEPYGLGTTKDAIRRFLGDSSNPLRVKFEQLAEEKPGAPEWAEQPRSDDGSFIRRNPNIVRVSPDQKSPMNRNDSSDKADTSQPVRARDRSREPQAGNSVGYAVRRLEREAANDKAVAAIYEQLTTGKISAHGAMVAAGFKPKSINIPCDPPKAGRLLARHFTPEQFEELARAYREARGDD